MEISLSIYVFFEHEHLCQNKTFCWPFTPIYINCFRRKLSTTAPWTEIAIVDAKGVGRQTDYAVNIGFSCTTVF